MAKTWLITGCSTGFGKVLTEAVLARGDQAVATARDPGSLSGFVDRYPGMARTAALDVTKPDTAAAAVALAEEAFGGLDVLVNNAGHGFLAAIEEGTPEEYRPMFETNVFGVIETIRAALRPYAGLPAIRAGAGSSTSPRSVVSLVAPGPDFTTPRSLPSKACQRRWRRRWRRSASP